MFDPPPPDPSIEIHLASRGYSKGLAQTDGAQLLIRGEVDWRPLSAQAQWKNVDSNDAGGEAAFQVGFGHEAGGFQLRITAGYKVLTGVGTPTDSDAFEFTARASREFGRFTPRLQLTYSPDDTGGTRRSLYAEVSATYRLFGNTSLVAQAGRRERTGGDDYTSFGAGLSQEIGEHLTAELRWYDTAQSARGEEYEGRAVASLRLGF